MSNRSIYNGYSFSRLLYELWDDLEYVAPSGTNYSAARSLYEIWDDTDYIDSHIVANGSTLSKGISDLLGRLSYTANGKSYSVANSAYGIWEDVEILDGHVVANGSALTNGLSSLRSNIQWNNGSSTYGIGYMVYQLWQNGKADASMVSKGFADLKANIQTVQGGSTYGAGYMLYQLWQNGKADASMVSKGFAGLKANIQTVQGGSTYGAGYMLYKVWQSVSPLISNIQWNNGSSTYGIGYMVYQLWQNGKTDASMISKGFSDVIAALDAREIVVSGDLTVGDVHVDQSGVESRLDDIINLLMLAGAKDVVDDILGDFGDLVSAAQVASLQSAMQNAFPFCIPAVVKQVLGLLAFEGAPPVFEFDVAGAPLVLDFSQASDFAEISRWVTTVSFCLLLLANTKKFVIDFSGGAS